MAAAGLIMTSQLILGIDPGSQTTGYGLVQVNNRQLHYVDSGCIRLASYDMHQRLDMVFDCIQQLTQQYQPDSAAIEEIFMHRNPGAALKLGQARGAALVALTQAKLEVAEYSARQVKQSVVGYGAAQKHQMQGMVAQLLALQGTPQSDAADALAIAICHIHSQQGYDGLTFAQHIRQGRLR